MSIVHFLLTTRAATDCLGIHIRLRLEGTSNWNMAWGSCHSLLSIQKWRIWGCAGESSRRTYSPRPGLARGRILYGWCKEVHGTNDNGRLITQDFCNCAYTRLFTHCLVIYSTIRMRLVLWVTRSSWIRLILATEWMPFILQEDTELAWTLSIILHLRLPLKACTRLER